MIITSLTRAIGAEVCDVDLATAMDDPETLSEPLRRMLDGLTAVHDQRHDLANYGIEPRSGHEYPRQCHPVVVRHPDTGRPLLFVNSAFTTHIEGMSRRESDALLHLLFDHVAASPAIQCRVRWEPGTLVFWDNRCTQHHAVWDYWPDVRSGERVTIAATDRPAPARPHAPPSTGDDWRS